VILHIKKGKNMNLKDGKVALIVAVLATAGWLIDAIDKVRQARWFMSSDSAFSIIGFSGMLAGLATVVMIIMARSQRSRNEWMVYGVAATVATLINLTDTTWLGYSSGIGVSEILTILGVVVAVFGYQQAEE